MKRPNSLLQILRTLLVILAFGVPAGNQDCSRSFEAVAPSFVQLDDGAVDEDLLSEPSELPEVAALELPQEEALVLNAPQLFVPGTEAFFVETSWLLEEEQPFASRPQEFATRVAWGSASARGPPTVG